MKASTIQWVECPRDAMQGWKEPISTDAKIDYLQALLAVGFHTLDAGSFVSPKAIPQMADTPEVLRALDMSNTQTSLLTIVANERGAEQAALFPQVQYLGFPFSISPTFQQRNANSTLDESLIRVRHIQEIARQSGKRLVVYLSMGFGNPYGDAYSLEILMDWASKLVDEGVEILSIADTVGLATAEEVKSVSRHLVTQLSDVTVGVHLHAAPHQWKEKLKAALEAGCLRIDGALKGIGGCPMAGDHLVGNLDSALVIPYLQSRGIMPFLSEPALQKALEKAQILFNS